MAASMATGGLSESCAVLSGWEDSWWGTVRRTRSSGELRYPDTRPPPLGPEPVRPSHAAPSLRPAAAAKTRAPLPPAAPTVTLPRPATAGRVQRGSSVRREQKYAERRSVWRERFEVANTKAKADAPAAGGLRPASGDSRKASRTAFIPVPAVLTRPASRASSTSSHTTPSGSPKRDSPLHSEAAGQAGPKPPALSTPDLWQGHQTSEAPANFAACEERELRLFLLQAGAAAAPSPMPGGDVDAKSQRAEALRALAATAAEAAGAWEVERVMACAWPEEVLRVPRGCRDLPALKAGFRRASRAVHPDKCKAVGAGDAMAVLAMCYNQLLLRADLNQGGLAPAVPEYLRQYPSRQQAAAQASGMSAKWDEGEAVDPEPSPAQPPQQSRRQATECAASPAGPPPGIRGDGEDGAGPPPLGEAERRSAAHREASSSGGSEQAEIYRAPQAPEAPREMPRPPRAPPPPVASPKRPSKIVIKIVCPTRGRK